MKPIIQHLMRSMANMNTMALDRMVWRMENSEGDPGVKARMLSLIEFVKSNKLNQR